MLSGRHAEKAEVLLFASVAVAVTTWLAASVADNVTLKVDLPLASVEAGVEPRKFCPSPAPEGSHASLAKNCIVKVVFGVLASVPKTLVEPPELEAAVNTGAVWVLLPLLLRRMPRLRFEKIELLKIELPFPVETVIPSALLKAIVLAAPVPPIELLFPVRRTPAKPFAIAAVPAALVPIRFP